MLHPPQHRSNRSSVRIRIIALCLIAGTLGASALTASTTASTTATASKILINTGGSALTDTDGNAWKADSYFTGGTAGSTTATISGTNYQGVFRNGRGGMSAYRIPVANGTYTVKLLEAEYYFSAAGKRIFDVKSEGALVVDNLDIFARAGKNASLYVVFKSTVSDGILDLVFTASVDRAKVDGIVIEPTAAAPPPPPSSVMWGMDDSGTFDTTEANLGRKFAMVRQYRRITDAYATARQKALTSSGHSLLLSIRAETANAPIKYSAITAGTYDATLIAGLAKLNALPTITYAIFHHEPDADISKDSCGSSWADSVCGPEFVKAWKHVYNLSKSHGYTNLRWVWTVSSYGFSPQTKVRANYYWVGTSYTDWIGSDAYNGGCAGNWYGTFEEMLAKTIEWAQANAPTKSIALPEWGATEGSSASDKANFFNAIPSVLTKAGYKNVKALTYWNDKPPTCDFRINTSTASYNAYKSLGLNSVMAAKAPASALP
ncbi:MAG: trimeric autotransporter adhesin [Frankiales bacterium]|jgi:hypothetical protein|nr:trimeric autotransporter adhesin [Frankiales bacterium]